LFFLWWSLTSIPRPNWRRTNRKSNCHEHHNQLNQIPFHFLFLFLFLTPPHFPKCGEVKLSKIDQIRFLSSNT
jgi:hypothetical protein